MVPAREVRREGVGRAVAAIPAGRAGGGVPRPRRARPLGDALRDRAHSGRAVALGRGGAGGGRSSARAEIVSLGVVEMMPSRDVDGQGAAAAAMLVASLLGLIAPPG